MNSNISVLYCPFSNCNIAVKTEHQRSFINHVRQHIQSSNQVLPFVCGQNECSKTFYDFKLFSKHMNNYQNTKKKHDIENKTTLNLSKRSKLLSVVCDDLNSSEEEKENIESFELKNNENNSNFNFLKKQLNDKAFDLINHLRSKNQINGNLLNEIINLFDDFIFDVFEMIKSEISESCSSNDESKIYFLELISLFYEPFEFLSTTHKQQAQLEKTGFYIQPLSINLGKRDDISMKKGKTSVVQKNITFEYVSIYDTIQILLNNADFKNEVAKFANSTKKKSVF